MRDWRGFFLQEDELLGGPRTVVFIDYQNAHATAHEQYSDYGTPIHESLVDPLLLGERVLKQRAPGGELVEVRVYRGKPDPRKEPTLASFNDQHHSAWVKDPRVTVIRRTLWYPRDWGQPGCYEAPREKGIDVALAIDLVRMGYDKSYEVGIVFSRDTDLSPAIEMVRDLRLAHVETAGWDSASRLRIKNVYHHSLDAEAFEAVKDRRYYGPKRPMPPMPRP